jgi:hypothetical protein
VLGRSCIRGESIQGVVGCLGVKAALAWMMVLGCAAGFGICVVVGSAGACAVE